MLPATTDATHAYYAISDLLRPRLADVQPATDLVKDPWKDLIDVALASARARRASASPTAANPDQQAGAPTSRDPVLSGMSPWLVDTMEIIDAQRKALSASPAQTENNLGRLATAEKLASYISDVSPRRRPQLNFEADGRPTFATAVDDFYIHLMVDEPNRLTWYATVGGAEHFDEGVPFDGRRFPPALKQLLSL